MRKPTITIGPQLRRSTILKIIGRRRAQLLPNGEKPVFRILDLFCGAGGATGAAKEAAELMGFRVEIIAINHWEVAVETWRQNYEKRFPGCVVKCCGVDDIKDPRDLFGGKEVHAVIGGPECIEFSSAAGGKPSNYQYRPTPWCMVRFTEALRPLIVLIENVKEFKKKWPPFPAMIAALEALGYKVSDTTLCAADFGDPTTRERLFIQGVRGDLTPCWPQPTHSEEPGDLFGLKPWVTAYDIIDKSHKGRWLDEMPGKKKYGGLPLSPKTLSRILYGLKDSGLQPIIAEWDNHSSKGVKPAKKPLTTITSKARHGLAEFFFVLPQGGGGKLRQATKPVPTVACDGAIALVEAFIVKYYGTAKTTSLRKPLPTVTTKARFALVSPVVVFSDGTRVRLRIRWRMLTWRELAAAQGFHKDYVFCGSKKKGGKIVSIEPGINGEDIVAQIGNAWPHNMGRAIMLAILSQQSDIRPLLEEAA